MHDEFLKLAERFGLVPIADAISRKCGYRAIIETAFVRNRDVIYKIPVCFDSMLFVSALRDEMPQFWLFDQCSRWDFELVLQSDCVGGMNEI